MQANEEAKMDNEEQKNEKNSDQSSSVNPSAEGIEEQFQNKYEKKMKIFNEILDKRMNLDLGRLETAHREKKEAAVSSIENQFSASLEEKLQAFKTQKKTELDAINQSASSVNVDLEADQAESLELDIKKCAAELNSELAKEKKDFEKKQKERSEKFAKEVEEKRKEQSEKSIKAREPDQARLLEAKKESLNIQEKKLKIDLEKEKTEAINEALKALDIEHDQAYSNLKHELEANAREEAIAKSKSLEDQRKVELAKMKELQEMEAQNEKSKKELEGEKVRSEASGGKVVDKDDSEKRISASQDEAEKLRSTHVLYSSDASKISSHGGQENATAPANDDLTKAQVSTAPVVPTTENPPDRAPKVVATTAPTPDAPVAVTEQPSIAPQDAVGPRP